MISSNIRDLYQAANGVLWIATADKGLCRLELGATPALADGAIQCLDVADGLHTPSLHRILPDDHGRLWFNSNQGIFWIAQSDLAAWAAGERPMVSSVAYSEADGLPIREGNGGVQNAGLRTTDGVLYFPTMEGLAIVDPAHLPLPDAPTPYIRTVRIGTTPTTPQALLTLPPEERNVSFVFTAPAFIKPESVLFQYRLVGFDDAWQMADSRTATYTNLPPGPYRFEVRAGLGGAWGDVTAQAFHRGAFFWETSLFWGSVGALILALFAFAYRQKQQQAVRLQHAVDARTAELQQSNAALLESKNRIAKQANALQRADDLKTRFLTNISHEFRTPLTLTFGPIDDLLHGHFASLEDARPHFNRARRNGSRLLRLINQLLDLSQLGAGAARLRAQPGDLSEFMRTIVAPFVSLAERRRITFVVEVPAEPLPFVFDTDKIEKIVVNLLSNAFKFTPKDGTVTVQLAAVPNTDTVQLVVADTGVGIAAEHLPHLFEQFYQVEDGPTRSHEGSGVGLALVKELATLHGGSVEVTSEVGKGTRFVVNVASASVTSLDEPLPVVAAEEEIDLEEPASGDGMAVPDVVPSEHVVLIVEDNPDMRAYLVDHLSPFYTVREARDGQDGLEQAQADVPDLVLTDVMMPRLDGLGLCAALKADRATSHIPILMLSAKANVASRITGYQMGADAYLPKPFDARELRVRIQALLTERARLWARMRTAQADVAEETTALQPAPQAPPPLEAAFLADVDTCLTAHLSDPAFTVDILADTLSLSPRQVHRKLTALTDETPSQRLRRMRLEEAAQLLQAGAHTVKQVAFAVGFKSESAFTRSFRQYFDVVPSAYVPDAAAAE